MPVQDLIADIKPIHNISEERLGYPTQKPVALLRRLLEASTNQGDVVLDPFCGCGTTIQAAEELGRRWIGIDVTYLAIDVIRTRMRLKFPDLKAGQHYQVTGIPRDLGGATALWESDPFEFQFWAVSEIEGRPVGHQHRKGPDRGIDGIVDFLDGKDSFSQAIVSVKGGAKAAGPSAIRDLRGTVADSSAKAGIFVSLQRPTRAMTEAANEAGLLRTSYGQVAKIQILTIEDILSGTLPDLPLIVRREDRQRLSTRRGRSPRLRTPDGRQIELKLPIKGGRQQPQAASADEVLGPIKKRASA